MTKINAQHINAFKQIVGDAYVLLDEESLNRYAQDATEKLHFLPEVILKPATAKEISEILKICNQYLIPVTPRGGGTGVSGGALPYLGGVVLSTERLNRILEIDEKNMQVTTEPGVITAVLQNAVKEKGLFYPPDPASKGSCFIGGNIAENSGGPKAVKYGVVKDYVLNLEVVLPTGEVFWTGANVLKNVTGYNLTQLIVGSEGTLGIVTKIVLKLIPYPQYSLLMLATFTNLEKSCEAVTAIFQSGITPSGLELMDMDSVLLAAGKTSTKLPIHAKLQAHLIIELDGNNEMQLMEDAAQINNRLEQLNAVNILVAQDAAQKKELWKLRSRVAEIVKAEGYTIEEDTVVPRAHMAQLIEGVKNLGKKHNFLAVCYGHAGDGNLHVRIKKSGVANSWQNAEMHIILRELFTLVQSLDGAITAEHGVGLIQKDFLDIFYSEKQIQLLRDIKKVFDPKGILNPGKIFREMQH
ncbi:MAG: FAD-binding oxidoreductase [Niabella sp.]